MARSVERPALKPTQRSVPNVIIATTAMLSFISFWRAAAVVLNDMGSSAFYAGAIAEKFIGKTAPWFVLAIMILAYAVRSVYIESCSMFVRGGVYRVVKEAMGSTLAKFSVSALMFDYILTGPISGVSAGLYLTGLINRLLGAGHLGFTLPANATAAFVASVITIYFWWRTSKAFRSRARKRSGSCITTAMVVIMITWCGYAAAVRGGTCRRCRVSRPSPTRRRVKVGWTIPSCRTVGFIGILIGLGPLGAGDERRRNDGAGVPGRSEYPKLKNLEKAGFVIFLYA